MQPTSQFAVAECYDATRQSTLSSSQDRPMHRFIPLIFCLAVGANIGGKTATDGTELQLDLPGSQHLHNQGGSDGAGLCVFTSISHSARWSHVELVENFRDYMRK